MYCTRQPYLTFFSRCGQRLMKERKHLKNSTSREGRPMQICRRSSKIIQRFKYFHSNRLYSDRGKCLIHFLVMISVMESKFQNGHREDQEALLQRCSRERSWYISMKCYAYIAIYTYIRGISTACLIVLLSKCALTIQGAIHMKAIILLFINRFRGCNPFLPVVIFFKS